VVRTGLLKESPKVDHRRPRLTLVAVHGSRDVPHVGAACLPVAAIIEVFHGRAPLRMLLAPLLDALGAIFGAVDGSVRRRLLAVAWGHVPASLGGMKRDCLIAGGI
jgi:hypothetical protein